MSSLSPKPIIAHVYRRWRVPPGLTFALVQDVERRIWVVESCPVGTQFWTVEQAAQLPQGLRTRRVLQEAIRAGRRLEAQMQRAVLPRSVRRFASMERPQDSVAAHGTWVMAPRPLARRETVADLLVIPATRSLSNA